MFPGGRLAPFQPARQLSAGTQAPCTSSWDSDMFLVSCQLLILYRVVCPAQGRQALDAYLQVGALIPRRDGGTTLGCDPDAPNLREAGISGQATCCRLWCQEPRGAKSPGMPRPGGDKGGRPWAKAGLECDRVMEGEGGLQSPLSLLTPATVNYRCWDTVPHGGRRRT